MSFRTKKSLGQHFLTDNNIIYKIQGALFADEDDRLIEIGPGTGALTKALVEKFNDVHVVEIDQRAIEVLRQEVEGITIHEQDVLEMDWKEVISNKKKNYVVGNLPYYITSPILFSLFEYRHLFEEAVLMMQKEVAERLVSDHSCKQYGILSVQTQLFSTPEILFDVSRNSFSPPPKVTSSVVRLRFDAPELRCSDQSIKKVVRTAFNQRRKKISNSLKSVLGDYRPEGFNFDDRAENWSPEIYAKLAEHLEQTDNLS
ncbi:MAG: ribosomal RNA small subunit methyltransferase A [Balneolaceae bacterium]|nr:ribosomal RNA small subunit methyltransferase A [Balneolaceae bacterium]